MNTNDGVNAVRTHTHIEHANVVSQFFILKEIRIVRIQQIGYLVQILSSSGDGRTQIIFRNVPIRHPVMFLQQRLVQQLHRNRIEKVNTLISVCVHFHKRP